MIKTITIALTLLATTPALAQYDAQQLQQLQAQQFHQQQMEQLRQQMQQQHQQQMQVRPPMTCTQSCVPTANGGRQCTSNCY
jgi:hypothetical protein